MKQLKFLLAFFSLFFFFEKSNAQDWANLNRFKDQNIEIKTQTKKKHRVVFMGDSITEFWKTDSTGIFERHPSFINRGISGQTTPQMLIRFRNDVIDLNPTVVVILAGINDIAGNTGPSSVEMIADNIKSMAELAKANHIQVIICSVLPAYDFPWNPGLEPAKKVVALNQNIKTYAKANRIKYVDYFTPMADEKNGLKKDLGDDGVHPNFKGYQIMEPLVEKAIKKAFKKKKRKRRRRIMKRIF